MSYFIAVGIALLAGILAGGFGGYKLGAKALSEFKLKDRQWLALYSDTKAKLDVALGQAKQIKL